MITDFVSVEREKINLVLDRASTVPLSILSEWREWQLTEFLLRMVPRAVVDHADHLRNCKYILWNFKMPVLDRHATVLTSQHTQSWILLYVLPHLTAPRNSVICSVSPVKSHSSIDFPLPPTVLTLRKVSFCGSVRSMSKPDCRLNSPRIDALRCSIWKILKINNTKKPIYHSIGKIRIKITYI